MDCHSGRVSHSSKSSQFSNCDEVDISESKKDVLNQYISINRDPDTTSTVHDQSDLKAIKKQEKNKNKKVRKNEKVKELIQY